MATKKITNRRSRELRQPGLRISSTIRMQHDMAELVVTLTRIAIANQTIPAPDLARVIEVVDRLEEQVEDRSDANERRAAAQA